jgi:hypothetical protein
MYCTTCGKAFDDGARFCIGCGSSIISGQSPSSSATITLTPVTHVVVAKPKKGGLLALKGLLTAIVLAVIFGVATQNNNTAHAFSMVVAFGMGAAYIITILRLWKRNRDGVQGAIIGWAVAIFLLLGCLGGLMTVGSSGSVDSSRTPNVTSKPALEPPPAPTEGIKTIKTQSDDLKEIRSQHTDEQFHLYDNMLDVQFGMGEPNRLVKFDEYKCDLPILVAIYNQTYDGAFALEYRNLHCQPDERAYKLVGIHPFPGNWTTKIGLH